MTPTLFGRIQTRIFAVLTAGLGWTLLITPILPRGDAPLGDAYTATFLALVLVVMLGVILWEPIYHLLQQFRWEKDWPALFILLSGLPEGLLLYRVLRNLVPVNGWAFVIHFTTTWLVVFVFVHGPMRVPFIRWRFRGGRLL